MIYYVNRDSAGWVEQHVRRRVYIKLKLECTRNRSRDVGKARDDWLCLYCRGSFPSKLRLTDHRVAGCACGPLDSNGSRWELPVYPNLKTAKQGKDLKVTLQRGNGEVWDNLHDNAVWLDLNPELKDIVYPPLGARVQERQFMEPTLETLKACPASATECRPHPKPLSRRPNTAAPTPPTFVDLQDEDDVEDKHEAAPPRPMKRSHAEMAKEHEVFLETTGSKTLNTGGRVVVEIGPPQTRHERRIHGVLAAKGLLPAPFMLHPLQLVVPRRTEICSCLLVFHMWLRRPTYLYHLISFQMI